MNALEVAVAEAAELLHRLGTSFALVGGLAVAAWTEPRFTQDFDFAVEARNDAEAESLILGLHEHGYTLVAMVEQDAVGRLATARLLERRSNLIMDLLFASSGIESEAARLAPTLKFAGAIELPVALPGHLIAMKVLSRDPLRRPQDTLDLERLLATTGKEQVELARASVKLITERGYHRGKDLPGELEALLRKDRSEV